MKHVSYWLREINDFDFDLIWPLWNLWKKASKKTLGAIWCLQVFATTKLLAAVYISTCWLYEALTQQNFHEAATCVTLGHRSFVQTPRAHVQKLYILRVHILSSFLYAGFMLYKFYMQLLASFLSLKLSLLLSILLLNIRNSTAINVAFHSDSILPAIVYAVVGYIKTLLQNSWLLSLQLLAM